MFKIFKKRPAWPQKDFQLPWDPGCIAIYDHIATIHREGNNPDKTPLPESLPAVSRRTVTGAEVIAAFIAWHSKPSEANLKELYDLLLDASITQIWEDVLAYLETGDVSVRDIYMLEWIARHGPHSEPIVFAIFVLGVKKVTRCIPMFEMLGRHSAFAKHVAVALRLNLPADAARELILARAKDITGWARKDLVDQLVEQPDNAVREWLVRDGFRMDLGNHYLAYAAATKGALLQQLAAETAATDTALLDGAADLFVALLWADGIDVAMQRYAESYKAVSLWFQHVLTHPVTLRRAAAAKALFDFASDDSASPCWTETNKQDIQEYAVEYLARGDLTKLITSALKIGRDAEVAQAFDLAAIEKLDGWELAYQRQSRDPSANLWRHLVRAEGPDQARKAISLAINQTPVEELRCGPSNSATAGKTWEDYPALDNILGYLASANKQAWPLVKIALHSPHPRFRVSACNILRNWGNKGWPADAKTTLNQAISAEPDADLRQRMTLLLKNDPLYDRLP